MWKTVRLRDGTWAGALLGLAVALASNVARSEERSLSVGPASAVADKIAWAPCTGVPPDQSAATEAAQALLHTLWLAGDRGHFGAYTMPGEKRNPFDLSPPTPDSGARDGLVQARPPDCSFRRDGDAALTFRFVSPFYRFHEAGHGWSPPLRDGLMLEAAVGFAGAAWQARDTGSERSILLPEQKPRRAEAAALPPEGRWAEPIPGCGKRHRWTGAACVARKK